MGIIKRQGIKNSWINYLGVAIGAINVVFIYPLISKVDLGIVQFVIKSATFLAPIAIVGLNLSAVKFFPIFKNDEKNHNGFLFLISTVSMVSIVLVLSLIWILTPFVGIIYPENSKEFIHYLPQILLLTILIAFSFLYSNYISNFKRIVVPSIFSNLSIKITLPLLVFSYWKHLISFERLFDGVLITYCFVLAGLIWYIHFLGEGRWKPNFSMLDNKLIREMVDYSGFNVLLTVSFSIALQIGELMVGPLTKNFGNVAVYSLPFFIAEAIDVPRRALSSIATPILSESLERNNLSHVEDIYRKSAMIQFTVGAYLLALVWAGADDIYRIMPNGSQFVEGKIVILILGLARLVDMATGVNSEIITYSKYYRFNLPSVFIYGFFTVIGNFLIVPSYGFVGTAWVTLASMVLYNAVKLVYIYRKLDIQPLDWSMLMVFVFGALSWYLAYLLPTIGPSFIDIAIKGTVVTSVFGALVLYSKVSIDINQSVFAILGKVFKKYR